MSNALSTNFNYTYNGREVIEVFVKPSIDNPDVKRLFQVRTGVRSGDQLFLAETLLRKKLREKTTCTPTYQTGVNLTNKKLVTKQIQMAFEQCEQEFQDTVFERALKSGTNVENLQGTELDRIIKGLIQDSLSQDFFRLFSFGDDGDSDDFYGIMEGLWPTLIAGVSDYSVLQAPQQFSAGSSFTSTEVKNVFTSMYENADAILKQLPVSEKAFYVTGNVYDAYLSYVESQNNEFGAVAEVDGLSRVGFRGIPVVPVYDWDAALADSDNPLNGTYEKLALYTTPKNHIIGIDGANDDSRMETWFSQDDRVVRYLAEFRLGYQYVNSGLQIIALNP